ncbi:MAG: 7,8-dihydropterin-6-yl-methyl-4-(beta-D-ribofuranosyl)aminobenzene 5-phosphate synthase [Solirubrobacteraceae bacterium]|jgi:7,8-dihydropterin-6-yl-methyl-4-(beta-D-ribofuranosyl)aminobenzene 5'-phosphate synthase|nr:7,8-dihydropterin-6-yl-methyl-4-(beta-D-ribofuranosyl)aminobenzene 5-phosphate synthase [Solirubrobacteraceae bacterium]
MDSISQATVTVVVDPQLDMLLTDDGPVKRFGLYEHFQPPNGETIISENGACLWIEIHDGGTRTVVLYDAGLTGTVALHNLRALGLDVNDVDAVVLSHAHPDHYRGLATILAARDAPVDVFVHPDAFLPKVWIDDEGRKVLQVNEGMEESWITRAGGRVRSSSDAGQIAPGLMLTGGITRELSYEPPVPTRSGPGGLFIERDGRRENDDAAIDEQALVLQLRDRGLVVITACGHAGIVNTIRQAQRLTGVDDVTGLIGGFHFGFPGISKTDAMKAFDSLEEYALELIAPMHCSGLWAQAESMRRFPEAFLQNVTGTTVDLAA